jgi:rRNA maturation endonuclease Nob1
MVSSKEDLDNLFNSVLLDTEALEDAKMTLEVIKKTDPNVYDEIIDSSIALIDKALSNSIMSTIAKILDAFKKYPSNFITISDDGKIVNLAGAMPIDIMRFVIDSGIKQ